MDALFPLYLKINLNVYSAKSINIINFFKKLVSVLMDINLIYLMLANKSVVMEYFLIINVMMVISRMEMDVHLYVKFNLYLNVLMVIQQQYQIVFILII